MCFVKVARFFFCVFFGVAIRAILGVLHAPQFVEASSFSNFRYTPGLYFFLFFKKLFLKFWILAVKWYEFELKKGLKWI